MRVFLVLPAAIYSNKFFKMSKTRHFALTVQIAVYSFLTISNSTHTYFHLIILNLKIKLASKKAPLTTRLTHILYTSIR